MTATAKKTKGKRGPARTSQEELRARGSWRAKVREKEAKGTKRPKAWDRERPGPDAILDPAKSILLIPGFDPHRDAGECTFDADKARAAIKWIHNHITHVKGSLGGQAYELTPVEQGIIANIFGWRRPDGSRRFRRGLIYVARKWGKTLFAAAVALYIMLEDDGSDYIEEGVEAYCAAAAREQAKLLWSAAKRMIQNDEDLSEQCRIYQHSVVRYELGTTEQDGSYFQSISAEANTAHGFNPQVWILDELHAQQDGELLDVLDTGTGSRREPLGLCITTADYERESICNEEYEYAKQVRDGHIDDPSYLPVVFEAHLEDDWSDEDTWKKANPKYPLTPTKEYMESRCRKAKQTPRFLNTFRRLNLNIKTQADVQWFDIHIWDEMAAEVDRNSLLGRPCYGALDMSSVSDLTTFVLLFPEDGNAVIPYFWTPRETVDRRHAKGLKPSYLEWEQAGLMNVCSGGWIDQNDVLASVREAASMFELRQVAVDRWNSAKAMTELAEDGIEVVQFGQGYASMSGPSKELERMYLARDMKHGGHPILRWCAGNVMVETDNSPAENIKPVKAKTKNRQRAQDDNRIDGIVALVMSIGLAMASMNETFEPRVAML